MIKANDIQSITIKIASPETIESWSEGEVTHYITGKQSEKSSLYSQPIFGPVDDFTCSCGKKTKGTINKKCPKCGTLLTRSAIRRERMAHIKLASPVAHPLFIQTIASLIGIKKDDLQEVLLCNKYLDFRITNDAIQNKVISVDEYLAQADKSQTGTGGEFILSVLQKITPSMCAAISSKSGKIEQELTKNSLKPEHLMLTNLPVLPADFRRNIVQANKVCVDPYNNIYAAILKANERINRLKEDEKAASIVFFNLEQANLQKLVNALFAEITKDTPLPEMSDYRPLIDSLAHKAGLYRHSLLGKRVDFSGRSVIIVDPTLKFDECGLPKRIALELFRPFIIAFIQQNRIDFADAPKHTDILNENIDYLITILDSPNFRDEPKYDVELPDNNSLVYILKALKKVVPQHHVLLNRTPSLHRLNMQAFKPKLYNDHAIHLHPLVCAGYNADFDGDTMSVHLPITKLSQIEASKKMLSSKNILSPADSRPLALPSQDMVLGLYYLTYVEGDEIVKTFDSKETAKNYYLKLAAKSEKSQSPPITLHSRIKVKLEPSDFPLKIKVKKPTYVVTTLGNLEFYFESNIDKKFMLIEFHEKDSLYHLETPLTKKVIKKFIEENYNPKDPKETANLLDRLKQIGFDKASQYGLSLAITDFPIFEDKKKRIAETEAQISKLTSDEESRPEKEAELWEDCSNDMLASLDAQLEQATNNPVGLIRKSEARGDKTQWESIYVMRGFMKDTENKTVPYHISSNLLEGVTTFEYFVSCHGTRKGLTDTALNTGKSGYLTRKLVLAAQDEIITMDDCWDKKTLIPGRSVAKVKDQEIESLEQRITGRYLAEKIGPYHVDTFIDKDKAEKIARLAEDRATKDTTPRVKIRSIFTCRAKKGICQKCYGMDAATRMPVEKGTPVGIIAAQSLCEPTTQFTLRSFHNAGSTSASDITDSTTVLANLFESQKPLTKEEQQNIFTEDDFIERLLSKIMKIYSDNNAPVKSIHAEVLLKQIITKDKKGKPISIGIKRAIKSKGFLAASSFENTQTGLTNAALRGATDDLTNINSNVIIGKLIPIGSNTPK